MTFISNIDILGVRLLFRMNGLSVVHFYCKIMFNLAGNNPQACGVLRALRIYILLTALKIKYKPYIVASACSLHHNLHV